MRKLTDKLIASWIEADERFEMRGDGGGLYLSFRQSFKFPCWLFRFTQDGEQHKLSLGSYPDLSLDKARELARSYRKLIEEGESVVASIGNKRRKDSDKQLAITFSALLREASLRGAKRMTVSIEFEGGDLWAS
ncbi:Arm DNA-binding domain-containing protein [Propionivibrio dicarboxylicus]|uniref:Integrase DNA-binding domain-containing protein n=1 Tax=Propionivibrio dicarboxylicus TaxID=83767 RepID=A0A1G7WJ72_9RHOO|nr:Arm DNA-binding domain-containing protein [Propionivibrio dicarboxylicus]SDG72041.1 protein of unknown function [Propionivibrio dicarboxylicus]